MFGTVHPHRKVKRLIGICHQMNHTQITGERGKRLTAVIHFSLAERSRGYRIVQIELTTVSGYGIGTVYIYIIQHQISQQLVTTIGNIGTLSLTATSPFTNKGAIHQVLCFVVFPFKKQTAYICQRPDGLRVIRILFASGPHGNFIQQDVFLIDSTVGHHSQTTVSQWQSFLPDAGRFIKVISDLIGCFYFCHITGSQQYQ